MKIIYKKGDVTKAPEMTIFHGCNAQGVMGSGVAAAIKKVFPGAFQNYKDWYDKHGLILGKVYPAMDGNYLILNAITQQSYGTQRRQVDYEAIYVTLEIADSLAHMHHLSAIAMPRFGAGLGGGCWRIIEAMVEETSVHYQPVVYDL